MSASVLSILTWVCVFPLLWHSPTAKENKTHKHTHTHTVPLQLLYMLMVPWIHVPFNNTARFLIDCTQYITHRCCANAGLICTYITGTIKMRHVSCTLYDCNCTACLSGPFSLLCEMGTQCLLLYLNTLIKQSWMVLRQLQLSCSTV